MASGCYVGLEPCPVCDEWVYEDEWALVGDVVVHERECRRKYIQRISNVERVVELLEFHGYVVIRPSQTDLIALVRTIREERRQ